jgi:hypothetical protein
VRRPVDSSRVAVAVAVAALVAVPMIGKEGSAWANPRGDCRGGNICLYADRHFTGAKEDFDPDTTDGSGLKENQSSPCRVPKWPIWSVVNRSGPRGGTSSYRLHIFKTADCKLEVAKLRSSVAREDTKGGKSFNLECVERDGCGRRSVLVLPRR